MPIPTMIRTKEKPLHDLLAHNYYGYSSLFMHLQCAKTPLRNERKQNSITASLCNTLGNKQVKELWFWKDCSLWEVLRFLDHLIQDPYLLQRQQNPSVNFNNCSSDYFWFLQFITDCTIPEALVKWSMEWIRHGINLFWVPWSLCPMKEYSHTSLGANPESPSSYE